LQIDTEGKKAFLFLLPPVVPFPFPVGNRVASPGKEAQERRSNPFGGYTGKARSAKKKEAASCFASQGSFILF
jgi:hypothetical protein